MNAGRWEQLKEAFWKAAQDGGGDEACVPEAWDVDPASRNQLRLLLDEHRRLAQATAAAPAEPSAAAVLPPGRFDVLEHLGSGAFGDVYRALDKATDSVVALKLLRDPRSSALYYFKREFRGLADIRHPNIAALHELIQHRQHWMFTMEFVPGTSLGRHIDDGSMSERESRLRACFLQLAAGLHFLHDRDLVHRDMKPSNVLVTREGRVVILDFGLARSFCGRRRPRRDARRHTGIHVAGTHRRRAGYAGDRLVCAGGDAVRGADGRAALHRQLARAAAAKTDGDARSTLGARADRAGSERVVRRAAGAGSACAIRLRRGEPRAEPRSQGRRGERARPSSDRTRQRTAAVACRLRRRPDRVSRGRAHLRIVGYRQDLADPRVRRQPEARRLGTSATRPLLRGRVGAVPGPR